MQILRTAADLRIALRGAESVGFVPTMGALHEGHCSLVKQAKAESKIVVLSIFVNPTQFGPNEDLAKYPRPFERDCSCAEAAGVDFLFAPEVDDIYPPNFSTSVSVKGVSESLCGSTRPGHFDGVATVVARLFGLVQPTHAYFGLKDVQQCMVLQRMVTDLALPVELKFCPTVRESDGLALSSRNQYLSSKERERAPLLYKALQMVAEAVVRGERDVASLEQLGITKIAEDSAFRLQYFEIRSLPDLRKISAIADRSESFYSGSFNAEYVAVCAVAAYLGETRLIDNILLASQ